MSSLAWLGMIIIWTGVSMLTYGIEELESRFFIPRKIERNRKEYERIKIKRMVEDIEEERNPLTCDCERSI